MDDTLEVKQEPHSDDDINSLSLQDEVLSLNIKKELGIPIPSPCVKIPDTAQVCYGAYHNNYIFI
jgi:hypothetical protein